MANQINDKARVIKIFSQLANINFNYPAQKVHYLVDNFNRVKDIIAKDDNVAGKKIKELWDCNWNVVWGPVLNTSPSIGIKYHADNSMYVVKGIDNETKKNIYIVAIAGTNSLSTFEMKDEDIAVKEVELWDKGNEDYGSLAKGSMTGLGTLLSDFKKKLSPNEVLMKFFEAEYAKDHNMEIITCGHSLGGALSPLVALRLKEWSGTKIPVSTYPTAGPTSGDKAFVSYLENKLEVGNYVSVINTNDIVPMAWEQESLKNIPTIYDNQTFGYIKSNNVKIKGIPINLEKFISEYADATKQYDYTRIAKEIAKEKEQTFEGQPKEPHTSDFMEEVLYQHLDAYMQEFFKNDEAFVSDFNTFLQSGRK